MPSVEEKSAFATIIAIVALLVSIITAYQSCSSSRDVAKSEAIRQSYATFEELTRLQLEDWQLSHMFALPDRYDEVVREVSLSSTCLSRAKQSELLLRERAIADLIFNTFEEVYYQWKQANDAGDSRRSAFLKEVLDYLTGRLLRNPRLLYYWSASGGGLSASYEIETQNYYDSMVLKNPQSPLLRGADAKGPFADERVTKTKCKND
jgi:hypothetical protein